MGRLPIRFNEIVYVNQKLRVMPKKGYTKLFSNMISDPKIEVILNTSYKDIINLIKPKKSYNLYWASRRF